MIASQQIIKYIDSEKYEVIVPDSEVDLFKRISHQDYTVVKESQYVGGLKELLTKKIPIDNHAKIGWYLQQFIKIKAAITNCEDDYVLIWDADTVPLKEISFINSDKKLIYYKGEENHEPYFILIKKLLGLNKVVDFSFIAQCFPIKTQWLNQFFQLISNGNEEWDSKLIQQIDFSQKSGFSEYETLGAYFYHTFKNHMLISERPWLRLGNTKIGSIRNLNKKWAQKLVNQYDYVSFENWDKVGRKMKFQFFIKNLKESFFKFF